MRVIAGRAGGLRIRAPQGDATRPTPDRVREALFSSLAPRLRKAAVLDLWAGSGALGIEALSRGAESATFVESARPALEAIRDNLTSTGLSGGGHVIAGDVATFCARPRGGPFDVVLCDAPYGTPTAAITGMLTDLEAAGGLTGDCVVVIERERRDRSLRDLALPPFLAESRRRTYGDVVLVVCERTDPADDAGSTRDQDGPTRSAP